MKWYHEVVSLCRLLFRWRFPRKLRSALHERCIGPFVSDSICFTAGPRPFSGMGQHALGAFQLADRLSPRVPCGDFQPPEDPPCGRCWDRRAAHSADAGPSVRACIRGAIITSGNAEEHREGGVAYERKQLLPSGGSGSPGHITTMTQTMNRCAPKLRPG